MSRISVRRLMIIVAASALLLVPVKCVFDVLHWRPTLTQYAKETMAVVEPGFHEQDYDYLIRENDWEIHFEHKQTGKRCCFNFERNALYGAFFEITCPPASPVHPLHQTPSGSQGKVGPRLR